MIEFTCSCGKSYRVEDEMAGKSGKCKQCGAAIRVPQKVDTKRKTRKDAADRRMPWDSGPTRKLARIEKKCGNAQIYLVSASRRFFSGIGNVEFRGDVLRVQGPLGPDPLDIAPYWLVVVIAGNFLLAFLPAFIHIRGLFVIGSPIFTLICVIYLMKRLLTKDQAKSIHVRREKIAAVRCDGPLVHIKFTTPPVTGVGAIRMFISPDFRSNFFHEFNKMFPQTLPEEYRAAL